MAPPGFQHWRANAPGYHPWGWHAYRFGRFSFGRRFFWFGFGAIAATAWARHHSTARRMNIEGEQGRGEWDGGRNGACRRIEYTPRLVPEEEKQRHWGWSHGWHHHRREQQAVQEAPASAPATATAGPYALAVSSPASATVSSEQEQWEADIRNYTRQASERVTEMSEATIDSLVSGLQGLKTRLAEHRSEMHNQLEEDERKRR